MYLINLKRYTTELTELATTSTFRWLRWRRIAHGL
jgi:hypothetical protein